MEAPYPEEMGLKALAAGQKLYWIPLAVLGHGPSVVQRLQPSQIPSYGTSAFGFTLHSTLKFVYTGHNAVRGAHTDNRGHSRMEMKNW